MRWADIDLLNHVTNVVYVAHAAEARADLQDQGLLAADRWEGRVEVEYLRPMALSRRSVVVDSVIDGGRVDQEITLGAGDERTVHATLRTTLGAPDPLERRVTTDEPFRCRLRRSDVGPDGVVTQTRLFEVFQEGRVATFARADAHATVGAFVVARVDVRQAAPLTWRAEPVEIHTLVAATGTKSFTMAADLVLDGLVVATADVVCVGFDPQTQRSRPLTAEGLAALRALG